MSFTFLTQYARNAISSLSSFLYTCFLFTKSDIKTTVIPFTVFAMTSAPLSSADRLLHVVCWVWLHVLQFDISNQTMDPEEDEKNKSWRPLPAKRISLHQAIRLRWLLLPVCCLLSARYSIQTLYASLVLNGLTIAYNELAGHRGHWIVRNAVNALGFASFAWGAMLVGSSSGQSRSLDTIATRAIVVGSIVNLTTIHAQDFKDEDGDRAIGRRTIPIVYGKFAKYTVLVPVVLWSFVLSAIWHLDSAASEAFMLLSVTAGMQYVLGQTVQEYQVAYYWYNAWISVAHVLPAYFRVYGLKTLHN